MAKPNPLLQYLNAMPTTKQDSFAKKVGTSVQYLRKAVCVGQPIRESVVILIEKESDGAVECEALRPDVDWDYIRNTKKRRKN